MSTTLIWAFVCLIIFVAVLAHPKLPNWMTFICMAPVVLLAKVMEAKDIYAVLNSSSLHLMIIICMFSGMIAATGLDIIIGDFVDHMTSSQTGKKKEMMIFAIVYLVSGLISTVLQNSYVALASFRFSRVLQERTGSAFPNWFYLLFLQRHLAARSH